MSSYVAWCSFCGRTFILLMTSANKVWLTWTGFRGQFYCKVCWPIEYLPKGKNILLIRFNLFLFSRWRWATSTSNAEIKIKGTFRDLTPGQAPKSLTVAPMWYHWWFIDFSHCPRPQREPEWRKINTAENGWWPWPKVSLWVSFLRTFRYWSMELSTGWVEMLCEQMKGRVVMVG